MMTNLIILQTLYHTIGACLGKHLQCLTEQKGALFPSKALFWFWSTNISKHWLLLGNIIIKLTHVVLLRSITVIFGTVLNLEFFLHSKESQYQLTSATWTRKIEFRFWIESDNLPLFKLQKKWSLNMPTRRLPCRVGRFKWKSEVH